MFLCAVGCPHLTALFCAKSGLMGGEMGLILGSVGEKSSHDKFAKDAEGKGVAAGWRDDGNGFVRAYFKF